MNTIGRKRCILIAYMIMTLSSIGFGLLALISNTTVFFASAMFMRFLEGLAQAFVQISVYSLISLEFPNENEKYLGYVEMAVGIGTTVGPFMGSIIFSICGYLGTFAFFSVVLCLSTFYLNLALPSRLNENKQTIVSESELSPVIELKDGTITYATFFKHKEIMMFLFACWISSILFYYYGNILSVQLTHGMGLNEKYIGIYFCLSSIGYALASPLSAMLTKTFSRRYLIMASFTIVGIGSLLVGPSRLLGLPENPWLMGIGMFITGMGNPFLYINILPEMISTMKAKYSD
jgi:MFS family permease